MNAKRPFPGTETDSIENDSGDESDENPFSLIQPDFVAGSVVAWRWHSTNSPLNPMLCAGPPSFGSSRAGRNLGKDSRLPAATARVPPTQRVGLLPVRRPISDRGLAGQGPEHLSTLPLRGVRRRSQPQRRCGHPAEIRRTSKLCPFSTVSSHATANYRGVGSSPTGSGSVLSPVSCQRYLVPPARCRFPKTGLVPSH